jgi:hypothetical protein
MSFSLQPHQLPEPLIELVAQRFRVLGEPMRIRLLDRLREADATVGELQQALGASQAPVPADAYRSLGEPVMAVSLTCFQRLGYFASLGEVPEAATGHVRSCLGLRAGVEPVCGTDRTERAHRELVRARVRVVHDPERARAIAETAIRGAALVKNNPPDLINVALEELIRAGFELPAFSTLDDLASRVRLEVNRGILAGIWERMSELDRARLEALLEVSPVARTSLFDRLKRPAGKASWSHFREQLEHLHWVDSLGDTEAWLAGIAPAKVADFAGEAAVQDAAVMGDYEQPKRTALLACLVHRARARARDELAEMFCKRVARMTRSAKERLDEIQRAQRSITERLIGNYRDVLACLDPNNPNNPDTPDRGVEDVLAMARETVTAAGGFEAQLQDIEAVSAYHGDSCQLLVERFYRRDRAQMFATVAALQLEATSADRSVLDGLAHAVGNSHLTRDLIPVCHPGGRLVDLSFASESWQAAIRDRKHPGKLRRV